MGQWRESTHRIWEWFYDKDRDVLHHKSEVGVTEYVRSSSSRGRSWTVGPSVNEITGAPASVKVLKNEEVKLRCTGPPLTETKQREHKTVWELLESWGAEWMWNLVSEEDKSQDLSWIRDGMINGTLVWCCDGSYKKKVAPTASGAGWLVYCTKTGNILKG